MLPLVTLYSPLVPVEEAGTNSSHFPLGDTFSAFLQRIEGIVPLEFLEDNEALLLVE